MLFHQKKKKYVNPAYQKRYDKGLCITCGKQEHRKKSTLCQSCAILAVKVETAKQIKCKANKVCCYCRHEPAGASLLFCSNCLPKINNIHQRTRQRDREKLASDKKKNNPKK